jgi:hypothetical protein
MDAGESELAAMAAGIAALEGRHAELEAEAAEKVGV